MQKMVRWGVIPAILIILFVILFLWIMPRFFHIQRYKQRVEKRVEDAVGRPVRLAGPLRLSLFPWVGVEITDLHVENPEGFEEKDFITIRSFEVRVKWLSLLRKNLEIRRFVLDAPRIVLVKTRDGVKNWEGLGRRSERNARDKEPSAEKKTAEASGLWNLAVEELSITRGAVVWVDHRSGSRRELSDVAFRIENISLDRPLDFAVSAGWNGHAVTAGGKAGPLGTSPGQGELPLDLTIQSLEGLSVSLKGRVVDLAGTPRFELDLQAHPFSLRKLGTDLGFAFPLRTASPRVLNKVSARGHVEGTAEMVSVSRGELDFDDSRAVFSCSLRGFSNPQVTYDIKVDQMDLDLYLPLQSLKSQVKPQIISEKDPGSEGLRGDSIPPEETPAEKSALWERLTLSGALQVKDLRFHGGGFQHVDLRISAKDGLVRFDPITASLYGGNLSGDATLDLRRHPPKTDITLRTDGVQAGPFLREVMHKDILEGTLHSRASLEMAGDNSREMKQSLHGSGLVVLKDGAFKGIDLHAVVRNLKRNLDLKRGSEGAPRTDFSEFRSAFTLDRGVLSTRETTLISPYLRVRAEGVADLAQETLDFRMEPKFVLNLKGQETLMERTGIVVPILVTGTFSSPQFKADLAGISRKGALGQTPLKGMFSGDGGESEEGRALKRKAKDFLKSLPFGK